MILAVAIVLWLLAVAIVLWLLAVLEVWACCVVAGRADEQMEAIFRKEHRVPRQSS